MGGEAEQGEFIEVSNYLGRYKAYRRGPPFPIDTSDFAPADRSEGPPGGGSD